MSRFRDGTFTPVALVVCTVVCAVVASSAGDASLRRVIVGAVVNMVAVVGIFLFTGMTGVFSFGQLGFMAIGAYTTGVLSIPAVRKGALFTSMPEWLASIELPFVAALAAGGIVAALVALLLSFPMSRMQDLPAGLATLAILVAVYVVAGNWASVTNGSKGMSGIPPTTTLPIALAVLTLVVFFAWTFKQSGTGLRVQATREDAIASRAVGIKVGLERGKAFVASGLVMGIAGGLYAQLFGNLSADAFYLGPTFLLIAMLVVGGMTSVTGAVLGTIVITTVRELLQEIEAGVEIGPLSVPGRPGLTEVGLGIVMLLILARRSSGMTRGREWTLAATTSFLSSLRFLRRTAAPSSAPEEQVTHDDVDTGTVLVAERHGGPS